MNVCMFIYERVYCSIESGREGALGNPVILRNREGRGSMPAHVQRAPVVSGWGIKKISLLIGLLQTTWYGALHLQLAAMQTEAHLHHALEAQSRAG